MGTPIKKGRTHNFTIRKPKFPSLKELSSYYVIQQVTGPEKLAAKINILTVVFQDQLKQLKLDIKKGTEPYEFLEQIGGELYKLLDENGIICKPMGFLVQDYETEITISKKIELGIFYSVGIAWFSEYNKNYAQWLSYIIGAIHKFGVPTVWDMHQMFCEHENEGYDDEIVEYNREEKAALYKQKPKSFRKTPPKTISYPRSSEDRAVHDLILFGIKWIKLLETKKIDSIYHYSDQSELDEGYLPLGESFMIMPNSYNYSDYIQNNILEWAIDSRANEIGVQHPTKTIITNKSISLENDFDFEPCTMLIELIKAFDVIEKKHHGK